MLGQVAAGSEDAGARARSQTDVVIEGIRALLTGGELLPGSRLPVEKDLAAQLGVSRGSLREGVRALAALGVLETRQGDGTYVTSLEPRTLLGPLSLLADLQHSAHAADLLAVRRVLEVESVSLAATRLDAAQLAALEAVLARVDRMLEHEPDMDLQACIDADSEFHHRIAAASGNPALAAMVDTLSGRTVRARVWRAISDRGSVREAQAEHRAILAELVRADAARAGIRMAAHLLGVEEFSAEHADEDPAVRLQRDAQ